MTNRHETLKPLTHDHYHALAQARRFLDVSKMADVTERRNLANDFLNFHFGRAIRHFREEEELFFAPLIDDPQAGDLIVRAVVDHLRLHALVRLIKRGLTDGEADKETLGEISRIFPEHVLF